ncbi:MAG: acyl-CoA thioesterase [Prevotellaceae bacterium]|jgi:acyl-CoA thioester hydrolase|nr:acyl-CoA thioesterase [Prevotellaceae bacterium]
MYIYDHKIRVRYGETDKMGVVYHGCYPLYYEEARTEMLRSLGLSYVELEQRGVIMPVREMHVKYIAPAYYDDLLTVRVIVKQPPGARIVFHYQIFNQNDVLINEAELTLVFVNEATHRPCRLPQELAAALAPHFDR